MKKTITLLALIATFGLSVPSSVQGAIFNQSIWSLSNSNSVEIAELLDWAAEEFNLTCGTDYCTYQLYRAFRNGELTIEQLGETSWQISYDGNTTIATIEDFG